LSIFLTERLPVQRLYPAIYPKDERSREQIIAACVLNHHEMRDIYRDLFLSRVVACRESRFSCIRAEDHEIVFLERFGIREGEETPKRNLNVVCTYVEGGLPPSQQESTWEQPKYKTSCWLNCVFPHDDTAITLDEAEKKLDNTILARTRNSGNCPLIYRQTIAALPSFAPYSIRLNLNKLGDNKLSELISRH
jgi:hypothetical protein